MPTKMVPVVMDPAEPSAGAKTYNLQPGTPHRTGGGDYDFLCVNCQVPVLHDVQQEIARHYSAASAPGLIFVCSCGQPNAFPNAYRAPIT